MDQIKIVVNKEYQDLNIKEFLKCFNVGRGKIEEIRVNKSCVLNGKITSLEEVLKENDELVFLLDEKINYEPYNYLLEVCYEDDYLLIVNKPSGMLVHPDDESNTTTLVNVVANYYYEKKIFRNVRYVHRIDYDTSGIVIFAKDFLTQGKLDEMISKHELKRYYLAFCHNKFKNNKGEINLPIGRDRHQNNAYRVGKSSKSKEAITDYEVINSYKNYSLVKLLLKTGRTHQIRVHMSYLNHPLLGDKLYNGKDDLISRVALHSYEVKFIHPITKEYIDVVCKLPVDMERLKND